VKFIGPILLVSLGACLASLRTKVWSRIASPQHQPLGNLIWAGESAYNSTYPH
jgi:hypothetical protein